MSSLQKPRKITVRGSDGQSYGFLCKPKDDLRKDARLMEFNSMIIKLLKKDSDARSRKLSQSFRASCARGPSTILTGQSCPKDIRTYSVVPLNEECGLIEWVPHVVVLRGVLSKRYASMNIASWVRMLRKPETALSDLLTSRNLCRVPSSSVSSKRSGTTRSEQPSASKPRSCARKYLEPVCDTT